MKNSKRAKRIAEVNAWAMEQGLTLYEAAYDLVYTFYEAAGFRSDVLAAELDTKSQSELVEMFCEI